MIHLFSEQDKKLKKRKKNIEHFIDVTLMDVKSYSKVKLQDRMSLYAL